MVHLALGAMSADEALSVLLAAGIPQLEASIYIASLAADGFTSQQALAAATDAEEPSEAEAEQGGG